MNLKVFGLFIASYVCVLLLYFADLSIIKTIENKVNDFLIRTKIEQNPPYVDKDIVIVSIDEESLNKLGQWPWPRDKIAQMIDNLNNSKVALLAFDILFAEKDGKSPSVILKNDKRWTNLDDYDKVLSESLLNSPSVMGIMMNFHKSNENFYNYDFKMETAFDLHYPSLPLDSQGIISNIPILQDSALSVGYLNNLPDLDGVIRYASLVMSSDKHIVPSISLEISRLLFQAKTIKINQDNGFIHSISLDNTNIPTDEHARAIINYKGGIGTYSYISAYSVYNNSFDKTQIDSKVVLIGPTAAGMSDNKNTPLGILPGVQIHANMITNIIQQDFIYSFDNKPLMMLILFVLVLVSVLASRMKMLLVGFAISVSSIIIHIYSSYLYFMHYNSFIPIVLPGIAWILSFCIIFLYELYRTQKQKQIISNLFSKKVSSKVMESLIENTSNLHVARSHEISIFFSDIRGFTPISEKLSPQDLVNFLNEYMTPMADIIEERYGVVDKYIGDAVMAYWNAPIEIDNHPDYALQSAIEQIKHINKARQGIQEKYGVNLDIGIGINTGEAVVGEIGSDGRSDYTIIGDAVNLAARVESLNKQYKTNIIITQFTKDKLKEEYNIKFLDSVTVKGKSKAVNIYEVIV